MFGKAMIAVGAALVLGSFSGATDASAGGHGQRPSYTVKNGTLNLAGPQTKPPSNFFSGSPSSGSTIHNGNNTNFGASGPYVGLKYIGKQ